MPVKVKCPGCEATLNAPDRARGKAVKCPKCGTGIRIPAETPAKKRPASVAGGDSSEFFAGLDLNRLEDRSTRVCPKCGTVVGAEDVDCPMCGADLVTGGLGSTQRARIGRKGAAPSEYYGKAVKDAARYVGKKQGLVWKSAFVLTVFPILTQICFLMFIWCHNWPPRLFWMFVGTVTLLCSPGWMWYVQRELILRALTPKREKEPVLFEPFAAVSLGIKAFFWSLVFGIPVWLIFGVPAIAVGAFGSPMTGAFLFLAGYLVFALLVLVSWPVAQAHFAMPVTWPGWLINKVLPDVGRNIGPCLFWAALTFLTYLPVAGVIVGSSLVTAPKANSLQQMLIHNSRIGAAEQAVADAEDRKTDAPAWATEAAKVQPVEIDWSLLIWPSVGQIPIAIATAFWLVFNERSAAYFVKLFRPNLENLVGHEREYVYKPKTAEDKEREAKLAGPYTPYAVQLVFVLSCVVAALGGAGLGLSGMGYGMGFWISCAVVSVVTNLMWWPLVLVKGFRESVGWGIGMLVPCIGGWVTLAFLGMFPERTKYESQIFGISALFGIISLVLQYTVLDGGVGAEEAAVGVTKLFLMC